MLSTFIISLFIGLSTPSRPATEELYHVLFVQGQILNKTSGAMLQRGDKLKAADKVVFKSKDAKAVVMSNLRGRFVMSANPTKVGSELAEVVGNIVSPLKTNSKLSTRGGETEDEKDKGVKDFKAHFGMQEGEVLPTFVVIGDRYDFKVNKGAIQMKDDEIIGLAYSTVGGTKGLRGLTEKDKGFIGFGKETFAGKFDVSQLTVLELYRVNKATKKKEEKALASFHPVFINPADLKASFTEILAATPDLDATLKVYMAENKDALKSLPSMNDEEKKTELLFYLLCEMYAAPSPEGKIDVNTVKTDHEKLQAFVKENKF